MEEKLHSLPRMKKLKNGKLAVDFPHQIDSLHDDDKRHKTCI